MKYFPNLSNTLGHEIFIDNKGLVYLQVRSNMLRIGSTNSSIAELRLEIDKYI